MIVKCKEYPSLLIMNPRIQFRDGVAECGKFDVEALKKLDGFTFSFETAATKKPVGPEKAN